jgi:RNAse (barnase) inhibitor barstar
MTTHRPLSPLNTPPDRPTDAPLTGIYKLARKDLSALKQAASELKHAFFSVDLCATHTVPGFIKALQRDLGFPAYFGGNLDALNDCLCDFSWHPAPGYVIVLSGSESLSSSPTSFAALNAVLANVVESWQARNIPFQIFYLHDATPATGTKRPPSGTA